MQPTYPQTYIAALASLDKVGKTSENYKKLLYDLIPNFSSGMIKNFHSWIKPDQAEVIALELRKFDV